MRGPRALTFLWSSSISNPTGLLPAEREVGRVEVPGVRHGVTFTFPDEQLHRNHSASQGQVGEVDSGGLSLGGAPEGPLGRP